MIQVTRLGHKAPLVLNAELIERIEARPDTTITLTSGEILVVTESVEAVVDLVIRYQQLVHSPPPPPPPGGGGAPSPVGGGSTLS